MKIFLNLRRGFYSNDIIKCQELPNFILKINPYFVEIDIYVDLSSLIA